MSATTSDRGYPYPQSTDDFRPYEDIQALAEAVDADAQNLWDANADWQTYTPLLYDNMSTTPTSMGRTVNDARYIVRNGLCIVHVDVTATATSSGGVGVQLPVAGTTRLVTCGAGGIFGTSPPTQSGTVTMSVAKTELIVVTFTNGFVQIVNGQSFRATAIYSV